MLNESHIWHLFFCGYSEENQSFINFYEEGSKIAGFMYIIEHATQERNTREVTDR